MKTFRDFSISDSDMQAIIDHLTVDVGFVKW